MSTWTSSGALVALVLALGGCEAVPGILTAGSDKAPLSQASLADGAVRVAMPFGYCIDPRSLRSDFALAARCDRLGADGPYGGLELAVITIAATPFAADSDAPDLATLKAGLADADILQERMTGNAPMILARRSEPPSTGLSATHWRSALAVGGHMVALSLYAPADSAALSSEGANLLGDMVAAIRLASANGGT